MLKFIFDYLTAPLSLPFNPILDFVICWAIGEVAFQFAYRLAGEVGATSGERKVLHWMFRLFFYAMVWAVVYAVTNAWRFVRKNWFWVVPVAMVFAGIVIAGLYYSKITKMKSEKEKQSDGKEHHASKPLGKG